MLAGIAQFFGKIMFFLYDNLWFDYAITIVALTIILRILLLPLNVKAFKSTLEMQEVQPMITELQRKYKDDQKTFNEEMMKLYKEKNINPMGGCLPLLIQMPILFGLFLVLQSPITYMFDLQDITKTITFAKHSSSANIYKEMEFLENALNRSNPDNKIFDDLKKEVASKDSALNKKIEQKNIEKMNMMLFGVNLGAVPKNMRTTEDPSSKYFVWWFVPFLSGFTTFLVSKFSNVQNKNQQGNETQQAMQKNMMLMMPLMSAYFSFIVPIGLSLYWVLGSVIQVMQQRLMIRAHSLKEVAK